MLCTCHIPQYTSIIHMPLLRRWPAVWGLGSFAVWFEGITAQSDQQLTSSSLGADNVAHHLLHRIQESSRPKHAAAFNDNESNRTLHGMAKGGDRESCRTVSSRLRCERIRLIDSLRRFGDILQQEPLRVQCSQCSRCMRQPRLDATCRSQGSLLHATAKAQC